MKGKGTNRVWRGGLGMGVHRAALVLAAFGLCACGVGGGEGSTATSGGTSVNLPQVVAGAQVASVQVQLPDTGRFVLQSTLPLPPNVHGGAGGPAQLGLLSADGKTVAAQIETVTRYPREQDGAAVVELIARVERPAGFAAGQRVNYQVVVLDQPSPTAPAYGAPAAALTAGPVDLPAAVTSLLAAPDGISVRAFDVFGHEYSFEPLAPSNTQRVLKHGLVHSEIKSSGNLRPLAPVAGNQGTLPYLLGAHAYLGTLSGEATVLMDLRVHNANDGRVLNNDQDDAYGLVYFDSLEVRLPAGYELLQAFEDPKFGASSTSGGYTRWSVVEPEGGGALHVMPHRSQFHRRLAIAPSAQVDRARALLEGKGQGFVQRALGPDGAQLYSWWNLGTSRWFPQSFQLPSLAHVGVENLRTQLSNDLNTVLAVMNSGNPGATYPLESPRLGWAHPWGISYGGMTGGVEIHIFDGLRILEAASAEGVLHAQLAHRMNTDRQANALFRLDGEPSQVSDWLVNTPYVHMPFGFYNKPNGTADPFGVQNAPSFQTQAVVAQNRVPGYQTALLGFQPHDFQHLIRYTRLPKVLAWIANDSLAKDDLKTQAEVFRMSYHAYPNSAWMQNHDPTGLYFDQQQVIAWPARGIDFGRGESWGIDVATSYYAMADDAWRAAALPWYQDIAMLVNDAVIPCSGHLLSRVNAKQVDGKYRASQTIEDAINHNALRGIVETVLRGKSNAHSAMVEDVLSRGFAAMIGPLQWSKGPNVGPKAIFANGPKEISAGVWCKGSQQPADGATPNVDKYQSWPSLAYGYERTKNGVYLTRAAEMLGGDLLTELLSGGTSNIENRAAILAVAQRLAGQL